MNAGDGIQIGVGVVLTLTLGAVLWYAWEARKQAKASARMAAEIRRQRLSVSQPVVVSKPLAVKRETSQNNVLLKLTNVGNGPAIRVRRRISHPSLRLSSKLREHIQEWPLMLVNEERDMSFVLDNPLVRANGELEVSWLDIYGQQFNFSALLKTEETGHIELGDVTFKVEETG
jgi:hypothetical protein